MLPERSWNVTVGCDAVVVNDACEMCGGYNPVIHLEAITKAIEFSTDRARAA